ncbi:hypothetical protein DICPUDRAFT_151208 [Dictyostelium purpureum]|uniref:F-box domain-containing protein n=1 Tax=Dictyostelium purpureum TaxID=5786 RepID=F0ZI94_DICPU|nr:uncharacterized protein DICPUDRAFT_151208 [Dictyostelium purpureum]EGC36337.1 hypothetical protein DICPUDRAFT_151208 [Dictyostelium purpureum]|eukprot:XP_003287152.1 hypothetical protein DICPUDRAFT_151208 [Dictyostelium purpureum]
MNILKYYLNNYINYYNNNNSNNYNNNNINQINLPLIIQKEILFKLCQYINYSYEIISLEYDDLEIKLYIEANKLIFNLGLLLGRAHLFSNLERVIIRNYNLQGNPDEMLTLFSTIKQLKQGINRKSIEFTCYQIMIGRQCTVTNIQKFYSICKDIKCFVIHDCKNKAVLGKALQLWNNTCKTIIYGHDSDNKFPIKSLSGNNTLKINNSNINNNNNNNNNYNPKFFGDGKNYLLNLKDLEFKFTKLKFKNINLLLKSCPKIEIFSFQICFNLLLDFLSSPLYDGNNNNNNIENTEINNNSNNNDDNNNNSYIEKCDCSDLFLSTNSLDINKKLIFNNYWEEFCNSLKNQTNLKNLTILFYMECLFYNYKLDKDSLDYFLESISKMILDIPNLEMVHFQFGYKSKTLKLKNFKNDKAIFKVQLIHFFKSNFFKSNNVKEIFNNIFKNFSK